jgi:threonine aldolase
LPEIAAALAHDMTAVSNGGGSAYDDALDQVLTTRLSEVFEAPLGAIPTTSGTGTNALTIATLLQKPEAPIVCHAEAHINVWEEQAALYLSRAPRFVPLDGAEGKISEAGFERFLASYQGEIAGGVLAVTEPTELGGLYSAVELRRLCALAHRRGMTVYVDGARLGAAIVALSLKPSDFVATGIDAFSFGGTKLGALAAEAAIWVRPGQDVMSRALRLHRAGGQRLARRRFVNVQILRLLKDDLWIDIARLQNAVCRSFADRIDAVAFAHPVETNQAFITYSERLERELVRRDITFTRWTDGSIRLVFCHSHTACQIEQLANAVNSAR